MRSLHANVNPWNSVPIPRKADFARTGVFCAWGTQGYSTQWLKHQFKSTIIDHGDLIYGSLVDVWE